AKQVGGNGAGRAEADDGHVHIKGDGSERHGEVTNKKSCAWALETEVKRGRLFTLPVHPPGRKQCGPARPSACRLASRRYPIDQSVRAARSSRLGCPPGSCHRWFALRRCTQ